jgi:hypothetical protein
LAIVIAFAVCVLLIACAMALGFIGSSGGTANEDGENDEGSGGGGPGPPDGGPPNHDPPWWPGFEREFAAYVESLPVRASNRRRS